MGSWFHIPLPLSIICDKGMRIGHDDILHVKTLEHCAERSFWKKNGMTISHDRYIQTSRFYPYFHVAMDSGMCFTTFCKHFKRDWRVSKLSDASGVCCLMMNGVAIRENETPRMLVCEARHAQWKSNPHAHWRCKIYFNLLPTHTLCPHR